MKIKKVFLLILSTILLINSFVILNMTTTNASEPTYTKTLIAKPDIAWDISSESKYTNTVLLPDPDFPGGPNPWKDDPDNEKFICIIEGEDTQKPCKYEVTINSGFFIDDLKNYNGLSINMNHMHGWQYPGSAKIKLTLDDGSVYETQTIMNWAPIFHNFDYTDFYKVGTSQNLKPALFSQITNKIEFEFYTPSIFYISFNIGNIYGMNIDKSDNIKVENITLDKNEIDKTFELNAIISPENASNRKVIWTSSDETVATVKETGVANGKINAKIIPVGKGTAKITVTTEDGNKTAVCNVDIYDIFNFVNKVDGSTVTIPLTQAIADTLYGKNKMDVKHNQTSKAINNIITGEKDISFVTYPSAQDFADAKAAGVELECVPVVQDAFVFLANKNNPVQGLSQQQIRDIYSEKITNWIQVGGKDEKILAFQRQPSSGSQSGMVNFMGDTPLTIPEGDHLVIYAMGMLIDSIAYHPGAIGYSYYYFAENQDEYMTGAWGTPKYLAVDGVLPSNDTVREGLYPLITPYFAVFRKNEPEDSFARTLLKYILSEEGQAVAEAAGYVGMPKNVEPITTTSDSTITTSITTTKISELKGDINLDGKVNGMDLLLMKQHILGINGKELVNGTQPYINADMNDDGKINGMDLLLLKKKILS